MSDAGDTWRLVFAATAEQARSVRLWTAARVQEAAARQGTALVADDVADVALLAHELFIAVLATRPEKIVMTLSTSGHRARVYATGPAPLPVRSRAGLGIITGLAVARGSEDDDRTIWAEGRIGWQS